MFATLGDIIFETLTSPDVFRSTTAYTYAQHQIVEASPRLQWMAADLERISLELSFHVAFTNPATQMNRLRSAAIDHQARALVFGNGIHRGYFVIESLEETHQQQADDGSFVALQARLELCQWIPGADFDPAAPPRQTTPPPGLVRGLTLADYQKQFTQQALTPSQYNPAEPGFASPLPGLGIAILSSIGAGLGFTYTGLPYVQTGVSALATTGGAGGAPLTPGVLGSVTPAAITRSP